MKIEIAGKGGSGKSTITALIAKSMVKKGYKVLVIDGDESNSGLHRHLGLQLPEDFMNSVGGKWRVSQKMMKAMIPNARKLSKGEIGAHEISIPIFEKKLRISEISKAYLSEKNGISLLAVGKIHTAGKGCACPMGALTKELLNNRSWAGTKW